MDFYFYNTYETKVYTITLHLRTNSKVKELSSLYTREFVHVYYISSLENKSPSTHHIVSHCRYSPFILLKIIVGEKDNEEIVWLCIYLKITIKKKQNTISRL